MEKDITFQFVETMGKLSAQNEEIIRRLNQQNGRVDRLEAVQWKIIVYMTLAVAGAQGVVEMLFQ